VSIAPSSRQGPTPLAALLAAVAAIAGFLIGYHTGVIAGALEFIGAEFHLGHLALGAVVTAVLVGGLVGGIAGGPLARRLGQRPTLMITAVVFGVCAAGSAWSSGAWVLGAWRFGLGLAVGTATMVAPLYVAETAPSRWRGALVSAFQLAITSGILVSYLVGLAFTGSADWRMMLGLGLIPAVLLLVGLVFLPESPRWLLSVGREDEARKAWNKLSREPWAEDDIAVVRTVDGERHARFRDLLAPRMRPALIVAAGLFVFTNLSGIDAILYYAPVIFREVGLGSTGPIIATVGLGTINVVATVLAMWLVDRVGRRPLLLWGLAPMVISLVIMSVCLLLNSSAGGMATIVCLAIFVIAFAVSLGPLPYVLMSEIFPSAVRPLGMAVAAATAWGVNAVVSVSFLPLAGTIGMSGTFFVFAGVCAVAFVFVYRLVPETKGRTLEEIERSLLHPAT
jgi:SP family galactose:H+ symporter-like MFS transporter